MNKKKVILSFAVASALWMSGQMPDKAEASTGTQNVQERVYVYHNQSIKLDEINKFIEETLQRCGLENYFKQGLKQPAKAPEKQAAPAPKKPEKTATPKPAKPTAPVKAPVKAAAPAPAKKATPKLAQPAAPVKAPEKTAAPASAKPQPAKNQEPAAPQAGTLSAYEQQVVSLTNQERAKAGLSALKADSNLGKMAREKSRDMSANGYFDHNSPTYGSPFDMMKKFGISYSYAGENIAMGQRSPQEVVTAWMNSEGHRKNILNKNFTHIGVGHIAQGNYWTQEFIGK
ncbi:CAP domain-containing protein [Bacillus sp. FJAT-27445]|uniref:CAP domain-containing protein n=1 Tax=Bacillus sp. FJAT-27445 TaxID=1679166 RepID=UPI0007439C4A|nr:CAP domain-containing protein [Bacillus sp. FJAT-27445]